MAAAVECYLQLHPELAHRVPSRADPAKRAEELLRTMILLERKGLRADHRLQRSKPRGEGGVSNIKGPRGYL